MFIKHYCGCILLVLISTIATPTLAATDTNARESIALLTAKVNDLDTRLKEVEQQLTQRNNITVLNTLNDLQDQLDQINGVISTLKSNQQHSESNYNQLYQSLQQQIEQLTQIASAPKHSYHRSASHPTPAINNTEPAIKANTNNPKVDDTLLADAVAKMKQHDFKAATTLLKNINQKSHNKNTLALSSYYLSVSYAATGQYKDAITIARKFITINPNNKYAPDAMRIIYISQKQLGLSNDAKRTAKILIKSYPHNQASRNLDPL